MEDTSANTRARLLAALVLLPVTVLARRRMGLASIAATSDAGQLSLHTAFTTLPGPGDGPLC